MSTDTPRADKAASLDARMSTGAPLWVKTTTVTRSGKLLFRCTGCDAHDPAPTKLHECRKRRLKLDPNLTDGQHHTIHDDADDTLTGLIKLWQSEANVGETITIELVAMTSREVEGLDDI